MFYDKSREKSNFFKLLLQSIKILNLPLIKRIVKPLALALKANLDLILARRFPYKHRRFKTRRRNLAPAPASEFLHLFLHPEFIAFRLSPNQPNSSYKIRRARYQAERRF